MFTTNERVITIRQKAEAAKEALKSSLEIEAEAAKQAEAAWSAFQNFQSNRRNAIHTLDFEIIKELGKINSEAERESFKCLEKCFLEFVQETRISLEYLQGLAEQANLEYSKHLLDREHAEKELEFCLSDLEVVTNH